TNQLAHALTAAAAGGWAIEPATLAVWLDAMHEVARTDVVAELGEVSASEALRYAIVGNVLTDPVLLALRRVAQEAVSAERFGTGPPR
ncbi:MAG: MerR family transcriptional regulator, partial [Dermatophilaceae bacterium]|nr:MerR family transcriptional regulator [Dermatophilaceae bacterium]